MINIEELSKESIEQLKEYNKKTVNIPISKTENIIQEGSTLLESILRGPLFEDVSTNELFEEEYNDLFCELCELLRETGRIVKILKGDIRQDI